MQVDIYPKGIFNKGIFNKTVVGNANLSWIVIIIIYIAARIKQWYIPY